jgi:hypothetical protein
MKTTSKPRAAQQVADKLHCEQATDSVLISQARQIADRLFTVYSQLASQVIHSAGDKAFVVAWHLYGQRMRAEMKFPPMLKTSTVGLSPLGILALHACAVGFLGETMPEAFPSTRAPKQNAS